MLPRANLRLRLSIDYAKGAFGEHGRHEHAPGTFPVAASDVGMIIKTGYATRDRLKAKLDTLGQGWDAENVDIAGDYPGGEPLTGVSIEIVDVLEGLLTVKGIGGSEKRIIMYKEFRKAVEETPNAMPEDVLRTGWGLDIIEVRCSLLPTNLRPPSDKYLRMVI